MRYTLAVDTIALSSIYNSLMQELLGHFKSALCRELEQGEPDWEAVEKCWSAVLRSAAAQTLTPKAELEALGIGFLLLGSLLKSLEQWDESRSGLGVNLLLLLRSHELADEMTRSSVVPMTFTRFREIYRATWIRQVELYQLWVAADLKHPELKSAKVRVQALEQYLSELRGDIKYLKNVRNDAEQVARHKRYAFLQAFFSYRALLLLDLRRFLA